MPQSGQIAFPCDFNQCTQKHMGQCYFQLQKLTLLLASAKKIYRFELIDLKKTDVRKIHGMERMFATHVQQIYIVECTMDHL